MRNFVISTLQLAVKAAVVTAVVLGITIGVVRTWAASTPILSVSSDIANGHVLPGSSASFRVVVSGSTAAMLDVFVSETSTAGKTYVFRVTTPISNGVANYSYVPIYSGNMVVFSVPGASQTVSFTYGQYGHDTSTAPIRNIQTPQSGGNPAGSSCSGILGEITCVYNLVQNLPGAVAGAVVKAIAGEVNTLISGWFMALLNAISGVLQQVITMPYLNTLWGGAVHSWWSAAFAIAMAFWLFVLGAHVIAVYRGKPPGLGDRLLTMGVAWIAIYLSLYITDVGIYVANHVDAQLFQLAHVSTTAQFQSALAIESSGGPSGVGLVLASNLIVGVITILLALALTINAVTAYLGIIILGVISPVVFAYSGMAKDYTRAAGWAMLLFRATTIPVLITVTWIALAGMAANTQGLAPLTIFMQLVIMALLSVAGIFWWLIPFIKWLFDPGGMGAGDALAFGGKIAGLAGAALSVAGMATGQPELAVVGAGLKTFGNMAHHGAAAGTSLAGGDVAGAADHIGNAASAREAHQQATADLQQRMVNPIGDMVSMDGREYTGFKTQPNLAQRVISDLKAAGVDAKDAGGGRVYVPEADKSAADKIIGAFFKRHTPYWAGSDGGYMAIEAGQGVRINAPPRNGVFMGQWGGGGPAEPPGGRPEGDGPDAGSPPPGPDPSDGAWRAEPDGTVHAPEGDAPRGAPGGHAGSGWDAAFRGGNGDDGSTGGDGSAT